MRARARVCHVLKRTCVDALVWIRVGDERPQPLSSRQVHNCANVLHCDLKRAAARIALHADGVVAVGSARPDDTARPAIGEYPGYCWAVPGLGSQKLGLVIVKYVQVQPCA